MSMTVENKVSGFLAYERFFYQKKSLEFIQIELSKILKKPEARDFLVPFDINGQVIGLSLKAPKNILFDENSDNGEYIKELELSGFEITKVCTNIVQNRLFMAHIMKLNGEDLNEFPFKASFYVLKCQKNLDYTLLLITKNCVFILKTMDDCLENYFEKIGNDLVCELSCLGYKEMFYSSVVLYNTKSKSEIISYLNNFQ